MAYPSPRRLQLRRGNAAAIASYLGYAGELVVDTTNWTLYVHDGVTVGGYAATVNTASISGNINSILNGTAVFGNIIPSANTVYSLGNITHQWKSLFVSNSTIYVGGVPLSIDTTGNLTVNGNIIPTIAYVNASVANVTVDLSAYALNANVTAANVGLKGYVDQANTIQSSQLTSANLGIIGYIDQANTIQSAQVNAANLAITAANVGLKGYVDLANTIQSAQLTAANTAWAANAGAQQTLIYNLQSSAYSNSNVTAFLVSHTDQTIGGNLTIQGNLTVNGNVTYISVNNLVIGDNIINLADLNPADSLDLGFAAHRTPFGQPLQHTGLIRDASANQWRLFSNVVPAPGTTVDFTDAIYDDLQLGNITSPTIDSLTLANTIQSQQIAAANVGIIGYIDSQSFYSNVKVETYLQSGNIANVSVAGNVTATYFVGNGALLTGIAASSSYSNVQTAAYLATATINTTGNITAGNLFTSGALYVANITTTGASGNISGANYITANYFVGNGALLTGLSSSYSNVQVATYLPTYDGVVTAGNVAVNGNVTAQYFLGNGALLTGIVGGAGNYGNIDVKAFLETDAGPGDGFQRVIEGYYSNIILGDTTKLFSFGNSSKSYFGHDGFLGNASINYIRADNSDVRIATNNGAYAWIFDRNGNLTFPSNNLVIKSKDDTLGNAAVISSGNFVVILSNGASGGTTSLWAEDYANIGTSNIAAVYANPTVGSKIVRIAVGQNGGPYGPNLWDFGTDGTTRFPGSKILAPVGQNITMQSDQYSQLMWENANLTVAPDTSVASNFYVAQNSAVLDIVYRDGSSNQQQKSWLWSVDGNLTLPSGGYILNSDNSIYGGGNYSNVEVAAYLNTQGYNLYSNVNVAAYLSTATITTTGNITAQNLIGNISITGNVTGTSANVTLQAGAYTSVFDNQGNVRLPTAYVSGNVTANYFIGNGALLTGIAASSNYSNVNVATYLPTYSGNIANVRLGVAGVLTFADGTTQTTAGGGSYSNVQVAAYLTTGVNTAAPQIQLTNATSNFIKYNNVGVGAPTFTTSNVGTRIIYWSSVDANTADYAVGIDAGTLWHGIPRATSGFAFKWYGGNTQIAMLEGTGSFTIANIRLSPSGNIVFPDGTVQTTAATGTYSNIQVATYLPTYSGNIANIRLGVAGVLTFADGTTQITAGGSSYSNVQVATYLPAYGGAIQSSNVQTTTANIQATTAATNPATGALRVMGGVGVAGTVFAGQLNTTGNLIANAISAYSLNTVANVVASVVNAGTINSAGNVLAQNLTGTLTTASQTNITAVGTLGALTVTGNATVGNLIGTEANTRIIANVYTTTFDIYGNVSFPGNVIAPTFVGSGSLLSGVATKITGSWTVPTGNSTQSFTIPDQGAYQLWVIGNIPNGIISYNATATITNSNVPVVGEQYAWVYNGGGTPIDFTSIPNQFVGTGNTIVRSSVAPSATTNRFDFGINNTSGGNVTVSYGYVKIS